MISPAEFGHAVIALILVPLSAIITFEGFASALVQRKEIEPEHKETAMLASLVAGAGLSVITFLLAPLLAAPLFGDRTSDLIQLASPLFLLAGICAVSRSLLWRELEFRSMSLIESGSIMIGAVAAVVAGGARARGRGDRDRRLDHRPRRDRLAAHGRAAPTSALARTAAAPDRRIRRARLGRRSPARGDHQHRLHDPRRSAQRGAGRPLLAGLPARRRLSGQDQRDHAAPRLPDLLSDPRPQGDGFACTSGRRGCTGRSSCRCSRS